MKLQDVLRSGTLVKTVDIYLYTPSGRAHFTPNGYIPEVGERWPKPALAKTLRGLAKDPAARCGASSRP